MTEELHFAFVSERAQRIYEKNSLRVFAKERQPEPSPVALPPYLSPAIPGDAGIDLCVTDMSLFTENFTEISPFPSRYVHPDDGALAHVFKDRQDGDDVARYVRVAFGVRVAIPKGHVGLLVERSSTMMKMGWSLINKIGIIDSNYRGELAGVFQPVRNPSEIELGMRIAQLVVVRLYDYEAGSFSINVQPFSPKPKYPFDRSTSRGEAGFGSTGRC